MKKQTSFQRTLKTPFSLRGVGIHSGQPATAAVYPAKAGTGIIFVRSDLQGAPEIRALYSNVVNTQMATTLGICAKANSTGIGDKANSTGMGGANSKPISISTVEHLLAALDGMGIDNARIEIDGPEVPVMDGSAEPFYQAIREAGVNVQLKPRKIMRIRRKVELIFKDKHAIIEPCSRFELHSSVRWDHPSIGFQQFTFIEGQTPFEDIVPARTFCLLKEVEALQKMGLAKGGSLENAVVLDDDGVINPSGPRFPDEIVRHKVLDAIGDLKLAGMGILGKITLYRSGHDIHCKLLSLIFSDQANYEISESFAQPKMEENEESILSVLDQETVTS